MIAIFTCPRPFTGEFNRIQRNAIISWLRLKNIKIFVFNDEEGTSKKICEEYRLEFISEIKKNKNGTPLVENCLEIIRNKIGNSVIAHVSTDIILNDDFVNTIKKVNSNYKFLPINFEVGSFRPFLILFFLRLLFLVITLF